MTKKPAAGNKKAQPEKKPANKDFKGGFKKAGALVPEATGSAPMIDLDKNS